MRVVLEKVNSQDVLSNILNDTAKFDGPMPYSRASRDGPSVLAAQRELIVKKGTVVFIDVPAVRECSIQSNSTTLVSFDIQTITLAIGRTPKDSTLNAS